MQVISPLSPLASLAPREECGELHLRVAAVQLPWDPDPLVHLEHLREGARTAAESGARLVCFQELTLSRYFADVTPDGPASAAAEALEGGPTFDFAAETATRFSIYVVASLFERAGEGDQLGFNCAIAVGPDGKLVSRTRKLHIPRTSGYYEHLYFRPGPSEPDPYPILHIDDAAVGVPTCWDQWFPELARAYSLKGAQVLIYPTAIGSEPAFPAFDTEPLWRQVIVGNAIANGLFMVAVNRIGNEGPLTFYGSSFICDPFGRIVVRAPRDEPAILVAAIDLEQCGDWLTLFPFLATRRPDAYSTLTEPIESR